MTGPGPIELALGVPGSPEDVWRAVATGTGISSWFLPVSVDEEEGGRVRMAAGGAEVETGTVAAWEPPRRVVFAGGGLTYEWTVEGEGAGPCTVRLVNAGFADEATREGMAGGWRIFLENLRLHLTSFGGRVAHPVIPVAQLAGPHDRAWEAFCSALGVPAAAGEGDRLAPAGAGVPDLTASVASVLRTPAVTAHLLVLDEPVAGTGFLAAEGDGDRVTCSVYLYLYGDGAEAYGARWEAWMASAFPPFPDLPA
jgi:uncharacterized protein YndB with AHSA1/START domain